MADIQSSIFNKKATEKLRSPDDLDKYVRVTSPSVWVVLVACMFLIVGLLAWGVFGAVTTNVTTTGTVVNGQAICLLPTDKAAEVKAGNVANVGGEMMTVSSVSAIPVSAGEAKNILQNDYLVSALMSGDWSYTVLFEGDTSEFDEGVPIKVNITTSRVAPISLILANFEESV